MIELIPAIDLIDGKCVRLTLGDYATKTVYNEDPVAMAEEFERLGFRRLHIVDLDGAKSHHIVNGHVTETLGTGDKYVIPPAAKEASIPTHLIIRDPLGSEMKISLDIAVNTPPHMDSLLSPTAGDTLYGSTSTAFEFRWQASDKDTELGDKLNYTLVIDGMRYNLGTLNHIRQSGFVPGPHSAYVIVTDSYGDLDSIAPQEFYVLDTLEGSL